MAVSLYKTNRSFYKLIDQTTLLAVITAELNGVIFRDMALKGPALYVCLWEFDREHLKNNANKGWR